MELRTEYTKQHADFPWLSLDDPEGVTDCLRSQGMLEPDERINRLEKAGEGNMNLTMKVTTTNRTFVFKQARPWVEKYDHIPAPWDRIVFEQRFYDRTREIPEVAARSPKILGVDVDARTIAMEFLEDARDFNGLYEGDAVDGETLDGLAQYLCALHATTQGTFNESLANREMRALNHEHIFVIPMSGDAGLELDTLEPGLTAASESMQSDDDLQRIVRETGERYLADGDVLLHGDFFPGSWLHTCGGVFVIDPEFCYYGDPEFDLGVMCAHLALAGRPRDDATRVLTSYGDIDTNRLARYAGTEVIRRLTGVAQLPIPPTVEFRVPLLRRARTAVNEGALGALWES